MKVWASNDKELRFTEVSEDYITINIFADDFIVGVMCSRSEMERLCVSLAEWSGIPLYIQEEEE
tara:strand:+ start:9973 stop:10164 length:192 start_codon:yes stop_codon:yes gene_type:complete